MKRKRAQGRKGELQWWYDILDEITFDDDLPDDIAGLMSCNPRGAWHQPISPQDILPYAVRPWVENLPMPDDFPTDIDGIADWVSLHQINVDLTEKINRVLPPWVYFGGQRDRMLPTLDDILRDPAVRKRFIPMKPFEKLCVHRILGKIRRPAILRTFREQINALAETVFPEDAVGRLLAALRDALTQISLVNWYWFKPESMHLVGGLEADADVYCLGFLDDGENRFRYEPSVARVGLWPDRVQEMLLSCDCGGTMEAPCFHLAIALGRCFETLMNPDHPGHEALRANVVDPSSRSSFEILTESALLSSEETATSESAAKERIAWRLRRDRTTWHLEPVIQVPSARGGWTKGRKVSTSSWDYTHSEGISVLDKRLANICYGPAVDWMRNLVEHPWVYIGGKRNEPVSVTETSLSLAVTEEPDFLRIGFQFGGRRLSVQEMAHCLDTEEGIAVRHDSGAGRLFFAVVDEPLRDLIIMLSNVPSRVSKEILPALTELLARCPGGLNVHIGKSLRRDDVKSNLTPVLRMTPEGETSLSISVGFHLFSDELWTAPGDGTAYLIRGVKGHPVGLHRNFHEERRIAQEVLVRLDTTELTPVGDWAFLATDIDTVVSLLADVRALDLPHVVEWPAGKQPWRVSDIEARDARIRISKERGHLFKSKRQSLHHPRARAFCPYRGEPQVHRRAGERRRYGAFEEYCPALSGSGRVGE